MGSTVYETLRLFQRTTYSTSGTHLLCDCSPVAYMYISDVTSLPDSMCCLESLSQIASETIREDLNSKFSPEGWWNMSPDPPTLLSSCYHPVSPPKSCMKPWVYFEVNFIFLTINVFVCPTWLLPKINIPTSGESIRVFQNYVCVQFVCKLCQRCSAIHAFLTTGWLWWLAGFHTGFWVGEENR